MAAKQDHTQKIKICVPTYRLRNRPLIKLNVIILVLKNYILCCVHLIILYNEQNAYTYLRVLVIKPPAGFRHPRFGSLHIIIIPLPGYSNIWISLPTVLSNLYAVATASDNGVQIRRVKKDHTVIIIINFLQLYYYYLLNFIRPSWYDCDLVRFSNKPNE